IANQVAPVMALDNWSAPRNIVFRSCCSSVVTLTSPETAATMITMTVIESISFRARRLGIMAIETWKYCSWWRLCVGQNTTLVAELPARTHARQYASVIYTDTYEDYLEPGR